MRIVKPLLALVMFSTISCQGLDDAEFEAVKKDYKNLVESEVFYRNMKNEHSMFSNLNGLEIPDNKSEAYLREWFSKNLSQTKFESVDAAIALQNAIWASRKKIRAENKNLYAAVSRATISQRIEILKPETDLMKSFPRPQ